MDWNYTDVTWDADGNATSWVLEDNTTSLATSLTTYQTKVEGVINATVIQPVFSLDWNVEVTNISSYSFLIVLLSIAVLLAVLFVLFGLFMKAGAHTIEASLSTTGTSLHNALGSSSNNSQTSYSNLLKDEFSLFVEDDTHFMEC